MRKIIALILAGFIGFTLTQTAFAHGIWITNRLDKKQIVLGEGPLDNAYSVDNVKSVKAYSKDWKSLPITPQLNKNYVTVEPSQDTAVVAIVFDYGYWTKNKQGQLVNLPMNQVDGATKSTHAIKYSVNYLSAVDRTIIIPEIPLQIVPEIDPTTLKRGDVLPITVYKEGKPLANVAVISDVVGNLDLTIKTDSEGKASITVPNQGLNVIGVEIGFPLKDNPKATQDKFFTTLSFTLIPEED